MSKTPSRKGPWILRLLMHVFTVLFGLLVYSLLSFVLGDIATWPGPDYEEIENRLLDQKLLETAEELHGQVAETKREFENQRERQQTLRDSTTNSQTTMNQLLEFQRFNLSKDVTPTPAEQEALAESQRLFLANQANYQQLNADIARLNEQLRDLEAQQRTNDEQLAQARLPVQEAFQREWEHHQMIVGAVKLAVLVPLLIVGVVLFLRLRESIYVPLVYAYSIAVAAKVMFEMHEYFPSRYFKYVLVLVFLAIVTKLLINVVRAIAFPKRESLRKQYREAYESFVCPVCSYPIRRGPLKYLFWSRRSLKRLTRAATGPSEPDTPYTCPSCGTALFAKCSSCHGIRHTLLPNCEHCGAVNGTEVSEPGLSPHGAPS